MLKIYIQIFGTIALVAIMLINYNIFYRTPAIEDLEVKQAELKKVTDRTALMDSILVHENKFTSVERIIDQDRDLIRLELPTTFSAPDRMRRLYDLYVACELESTGLPLLNSLPAKDKSVKLSDVVPNLQESDKFMASVNSFQKAMSKLEGDLPKFLANESPMERWNFYDTISQGLPADKIKLNLGYERHRFRLNLTGTYANVKRFLWLIANDKPLFQATSVRITPKLGLGETRLFQLDCVVIAYADRNTVYEQLNQDPTALLNTKAPASEDPVVDAAAAAAAK